MLKKTEIADILRGGVKHIISKASAPCFRELASKYRRSSHPSREFMFVISGSGYFMCNDSVYPCKSGTLFLFDSGVPHGHRYTREDNNLLHLWGYFHERLLHLSIIEVHLNGQSNGVKNMRRFIMPEYLLHLIENRWNLLTMQENITPQMVEEYMKAPVNAALDEMAFRITADRQEGKAAHTPMSDLMEYIRSRGGRECSLEHLAEVSGYTRGYLAHKFRDDTGITVGEYIDKVRLEYIRNAKKRGLRQKEMAYELGFSTPTAFWNWFRKYRDQV